MQGKQEHGLRPCPHCGEAARMLLDNRSFGARCLACGFAMELVLNTERMIRQAWNTQPRRTA